MRRSRSLTVDRSAAAADLLGEGFVHLRLSLRDTELAWSCARAIFEEAAGRDAVGAGMPALDVVGEFTLPPPGARRRDFQALHVDFGLPVVAERRTDVARFTALHVDRDRAPTTALTRIVPLRRLLGQRRWSDPEVLGARLRGYAGGAGDVEGIFARLIEAADDSPTLPGPGGGLLCGMEFDSAAGERAHLAARGLDLEAVEQRVRLGPGELLLFDNLATVHGRLGVREPSELHQLCVGYPRLDVPNQVVLLRRVLEAFSGPVGDDAVHGLRRGSRQPHP